MICPVCQRKKGAALDLPAIVMETIKSEFGLLAPNPSNPRSISPAAFNLLKESIRRDPHFMRLRPVVLGPEGNVIGGNQRLKACIALEMSEMPPGWVVRADEITPEQAKRFVLVDNAPDGMSGQWDADALARDYGFSELSGIGFDLSDLRGFDAVGRISQDEAPESSPLQPFSQSGGIYRFGGHTLMCGLAESSHDVALLTGGAKADMCFTDPPYNVAYEGEAGTIDNDDLPPEAFAQLLRAWMASIVRTTSGGIYVCMSTKEMPPARAAFQEAGGQWSCDIVWVKDGFTLGRGDYQHQFESIMYGWPQGVKHYFCRERNEPTVWEDVTGVKAFEDQGRTVLRFCGFEVSIEGRITGTVRRQKAKTDIWRFDKPVRSSEHPTMKPVALCATAIRNSSRRGDVVVDFFGGSGSTLMACEQLGRSCWMMEKKPAFCDVIRKRWWISKNGSYDGWQEGTGG